MDKKFQSAKKFVADEKNRTTVIAAAAGVVATIVGVVGTIFMTKRGKKKRK